jgi:hypothetical protein
MDSIKQSIGAVSVRQCEPIGGDPARGVRMRVCRTDGSAIGEFTLVQGDDGWLPVPVPGAAHPGLLHSTAIDFAREVNEGRVGLD